MPGFLSRAALLLALLLIGCGPANTGGVADSEQTLLVSGAPGGVRAPVLLAVDRGFDEAEGVDVTLRGDGDAYDLLTSGRADAAVVGVDQLRPPLVAVLAFVEGDEAGRPRRPGEPPRPGVLLAVTRDTLTDRRPEVAALVRALQRGMTEAATDPESAVTAALDRDETLDRTRLTEQLDRAAPGFGYGAVDSRALEAWGRWAHKDVAADATLARPVSRD